MAQAKQTPQEFIQNVFSPSVAAMCSADAEELCHKNNLSFVELIQPFCRFNSEATYKDPLNQTCSIRNLRVVVKDLTIQLPLQSVAKKMLNDVVLNCQPAGENNRCISVKSFDMELGLPAVLPWFEAYRDCFFDVSYPSDHEFTKHFLACIFVVSSSIENPVAELTRLNQLQHELQHQNPNKLPKWFLPNIFKGYIILHDISNGDNAKAEAVYQNTKSTFPGSFCHLLQINSRPLSSIHELSTVGEDGAQPADPWSQFLSKKIDMADSCDYDNSPRTPQEDNIFPNKLSEGGSDLDITQIAEVGTEVTENQLHNDSTDMPITFDHPLSPSNETITSSYLSPEKNEKTLKIEAVNEEDTPLAGILNDSAWIKEQSSPKPHGLCLTVSDLDRLRIFIHEFVIRGLLPYVEKQMKFLNEAVATRKGLHRSLLSATKKWFVGNKPGFQGPASANTVIYSQEATELQVRKLGDLAFMFQHYDLAYQAYHTAKRDFSNDQAWLYFAGALEMAALSIFMLGTNSQRQYPFHYFENSVNTYLNVCKSSLFATRATLLSSECLKSKGMFGEAAMQFIKMTSEDSDLRSALLLEQAAHCFIAMPTPMTRKYAFHMILAGHRFSKAGQRKHALRSYKQAHQVYKARNWSLAEDHINFTIGRQSLNLKVLQQALDAFNNLLNKNSQQSTSQQTSFLREYLFVYNLAREQNIITHKNNFLPLPVIENQSVRVTMGPVLPSTNVDAENARDNKMWFLLEDLAYRFVHGAPPVALQPTMQHLNENTNNFYKPLGVVNEPITLQIVMNNPFRIPLLLCNIYLLWKFTVEKIGDEETDWTTISNDSGAAADVLDCTDAVATENIQELIIESNHSEKVILSLRPQRTGKLMVLGVAYELGTYSPGQSAEANADSSLIRNVNPVVSQGKQYINVQGQRLNNTKSEKASESYGPDYRLEYVIVPAMPYLQVNVLECPQTLISGEIQQLLLEVTNTGQDDITNICLACLTPEMFAFGQCTTDARFASRSLSSCASTSNKLYADIMEKSADSLAKIPVIDRVCYVPLPKDWTVLKGGTSYNLPLWVRGPDESGIYNLEFLFYYESSLENPSMRYRICRCSNRFTVTKSLNVRAFAVQSYAHLMKDDASSLSIAVEMENANELPENLFSEIIIMQISSASQNWILQPPEKLSDNDIVINVKETARLCFQAVKIHSQSSDLSVVFSNVSFNSREIDSTVTPCADFCYRSQLNLPSLVQEPAFQSENMILPASLYTNAASENGKVAPQTKDDSEEAHVNLGLTLIIIWKASVTDALGSNTIIMGQHHVPVTRLNSLDLSDIEAKDKDHATLIQPTSELDQPPFREKYLSGLDISEMVQSFVYHPRQVVHNFHRSRTCIVSVAVILHNCSDVALYVILDARKSNTSNPVMKASLTQPSGFLATFVAPSADAFSWIGSTYHCLSIQPDETTQVRLKACFFSAGTYNLGNMFIGARNLLNIDNVLTSQKQTSPSLIIVNNSLHPS